MKRKTCKMKLLAVMMMMGSSLMASAQQKSSEIDWTKDFGAIRTLTTNRRMLTT